MMLTPCWPSAGPTGGAGVAAPALIWSLMTAVNRFLGGMTFLLRERAEWWWNGPGAGSRPGRSEGRGAPGSSDYNLATWVNDSSTGVSRPKIETSTCSFACSALISLMVAGRVANGPSMTVTDSPTSKSTTVAGADAAAGEAASATLAARGGGPGTSRLTTPASGRAAGGGAAAAPLAACGGASGPSRLTTSSIVSGEGREVAPTKPVTPGVLRTAPQDSSLRSIRTSR